MSLQLGSYYKNQAKEMVYGTLKGQTATAGNVISGVVAKDIVDTENRKLRFIENYVDNPYRKFYSRTEKWNGELQEYNAEENLVIDKGSLKMYAQYINGQLTSSRMASGFFNTQNYQNTEKFTFYYGAIEGRVKFTNVQQCWCAFWIMALGITWPQGGEIELMENWNGPNTVDPTGPNTKYTCITNNISGDSFNDIRIACAAKTFNVAEETFNPCTEFHTYRLEKRYGNIKVFIDGVLTAEHSNDNGQLKYEIKDPSWRYVSKDMGNSSVGWVYDSGHKYMVLLTQYLGGAAFEENVAPNANDLPTYSEYEYIKFEELEDTPNTQFANRKAPDDEQTMNSKVHVEAVSRRYCKNIE